MSKYDLIRFKKKQLEATDALIEFLKKKKIVSKDKKTTDDLRWYIGMIYGNAYDEGIRAMERENKRSQNDLLDELKNDDSDFARDVLREFNKQ
tara:strand:+ start:63 stop:341 length:279 start_codon:yes stop_codon:yes gene_type:complete